MGKKILKCGLQGMLWGCFACLAFSVLLSLRLGAGRFHFVLPVLATEYGNKITTGILQILLFLWLGAMGGIAYAIGYSSDLAFGRQLVCYLGALTAGFAPLFFLGHLYEHLFIGIFSYLIFLAFLSALLYLIGWIRLRKDIAAIRKALHAATEKNKEH